MARCLTGAMIAIGLAIMAAGCAEPQSTCTGAGESAVSFSIKVKPTAAEVEPRYDEMRVGLYSTSDQYGRDREWLVDLPVDEHGCASTQIGDNGFYQAQPLASSPRFDDCSIWGAGAEVFEYSGTPIQLEFVMKHSVGCEPN